MGESFVVTKQDEAPARAARLREIIASPVLTGVKVAFDGFDAYDVEPAHVPDLLAERPVIVFGKYRGKAAGGITVTGRTGNAAYRQTIDAGSVKAMPSNAALRYLWARHRIALLSDYNNLRQNDARIKEVTDLGLRYNLLTAYTSFVAVDSQVRARPGDAQTVKQPLPLPEGVSGYAVGGAANGMAMPPAVYPAPAGGMPMYSMQRMVSKKAAREDAAAPGMAATEAVREAGEPKQKSEAEARPAVVVVNRVTATGGLSVQAVTDAAKAQAKTLARYYRQGKTRLVVQLTIDATGKVTAVRVVQSGAFSKEAAEALKGWSFPAAEGGARTTATIAFAVGA
jgi:Ca-activated chloride channel family protein